jgi:hypothetical protein
VAKKPAARDRAAHPPEKKIGPFAGGVGVAIWRNRVETDNGPREIRSISIAPRRYQDRKTGEWRDSGSYRPQDLPALIFALSKAQEYVFTTPLAREPGEDDEESGEPHF